MNTTLIALCLAFIGLTPCSLLARTVYTPSDVLTTTMILEAGGEKHPHAMLAVGCVIMNRVEKQHKDVTSVCLAPKQFSCFNNAPLSKAVTTARRHAKWAQAKALANDLLAYGSYDVTYGATHYYNPSLCNPTWARKCTPTVAIGAHRFMK